MDSGFVEMLKTHRLSTARRLFVLEQILARAEVRSPGDLVVRIRRVMALDHQSLKREMVRTDQSPSSTWNSHHEYADAALRAHHKFVDLARHIIAAYPEAAAYYLLAPAEQQCNRLRDFAARSDNNFSFEGPGDRQPTEPAIRTNS